MNSENVKDKDSKVLPTNLISFNKDLKILAILINPLSPIVINSKNVPGSNSTVEYLAKILILYFVFSFLYFVFWMFQVEYLAKIIDALSLATGESLAVKPGDHLWYDMMNYYLF